MGFSFYPRARQSLSCSWTEDERRQVKRTEDERRGEVGRCVRRIVGSSPKPAIILNLWQYSCPYVQGVLAQLDSSRVPLLENHVCAYFSTSEKANLVPALVRRAQILLPSFPGNFFSRTRRVSRLHSELLFPDDILLPRVGEKWHTPTVHSQQSAPDLQKRGVGLLSRLVGV